MEITLKRTASYVHQTSGILSVNGAYECVTLEDTDRGLFFDTPLSEIKKNKVYGQTAIPRGRYEVIISYSNNFKKLLPLLLNVPGFEGIRIHSGNTEADTLGCILVGKELASGKTGAGIKGGTSRPAFDALFKKIQTAIKKEKIWITIA